MSKPKCPECNDVGRSGGCPLCGRWDEASQRAWDEKPDAEPLGGGYQIIRKPLDDDEEEDD